MKKWGALIGIILVLGIAIPAFAITAPTSYGLASTLPFVKVFRNLANPGDTLYVFEHLTTWSGNVSSTPASDSWMFKLWDSDNTTLKASTHPYVFSYFGDNGYGMGVSAFYFGASDNASTWGSAVRIDMYGVPAYYSPALSYSYTLTAGDYVTVTSQEDNRSELASFVLLLGDRLQTNYSSTGITFSLASDSGIVLASYGDIYFRGAIPGLQAMCPQLFYIQVAVPTTMIDATSYNMTVGTTYGHRLDTDDLRRGFDRLGALMGGISGGFTAAMVCFIMCLAVCFVTTKKGWGTEIGMLISVLIGLFFALTIGNTLYALLIISSLVAALGLVWIFTLKRA